MRTLIGSIKEKIFLRLRSRSIWAGDNWVLAAKIRWPLLNRISDSTSCPGCKAASATSIDADGAAYPSA